MTGVLLAVTVVFVVLKLTGVVAWSWWLVLLPALFEAGVAVACFSVIGAVAYFTNKHTRK